MNSCRIPLVVGVTGHRDIRDKDRPRLEAKVREILTELQTSHPNSPLVLLDSLAEGADRLVAHIALACGAQLIAPLPMPPEEYGRDFETEASQQEFAALLKQSAGSLVLPYPPGMTPEGIRDEANRARQYAKSGQYILRHCHLLLALWDGEKAEKTGGTSQIVRQKLSGFSTGETPDWAPLIPVDAGTVYHLVTPRISNPEPSGSLELRKYYLSRRSPGDSDEAATDEKNAEKIFNALLERTDTFNHDVAGGEAKLAGEFERSRQALDAGQELGKLDDDLGTLLGPYSAADVLASQYQKKRRHSLFCICVFAVVAPVFLAAYHTVSTSNSGYGLAWLALFFIAFFVTFTVYLTAKRRGYETKHLDYRALAEGMKVLYFWRLAGLHDDVGAQYLRKQRSEIDWIRLAVRAADLRTSLQPGAVEPYAWIETHWIEDQVHYFKRSAERNGRAADRCELGARVLIKSGVLMAAVMLACHAFYFGEHRALPEGLAHYFHILSVVIVGSLAAGGSLTAYAEKMAFGQLAKQYAQMHRVFVLALTECRASRDHGGSDRARAVIRRLGHEALRENGDWVLLHRERPMELKLG